MCKCCKTYYKELEEKEIKYMKEKYPLLTESKNNHDILTEYYKIKNAHYQRMFWFVTLCFSYLVLVFTGFPKIADILKVNFVALTF
jgi:hypothetical protein